MWNWLSGTFKQLARDLSIEKYLERPGVTLGNDAPIGHGAAG